MLFLKYACCPAGRQASHAKLVLIITGKQTDVNINLRKKLKMIIFERIY